MALRPISAPDESKKRSLASVAQALIEANDWIKSGSRDVFRFHVRRIAFEFAAQIAQELDSYEFKHDISDASIVRSVAFNYIGMVRAIRDLESRLPNDPSAHTISAVIDLYRFIVEDWKHACEIKIRERFSDFKLIDDSNLAEDEFINRASNKILEGLDVYTSRREDKREIWNRIIKQVEAKLDPAPPRIPAAPPYGQTYPDSFDVEQDKDIVGFIQRVYGTTGYLTGEFTRADLRKIDRAAAKALYNWEQPTDDRPKRRAPLNLPTISERNDRLIAADPATLNHAERAARSRLISKRNNAQKKPT